MAVKKGWVVAILLVFVMAGVGLVGLGLLLSEKRVEVKSGTTLVLDFKDDVVEDTPAGTRSQLFYRDYPTLWDHLRALDHVATDSRIEAVLLKIDNNAPSWAKVEEIRDRLVSLQESGKKVIAYVQGGTDRDYVLATAADVIYMSPNTNLFLDGLAAYETFLKGTLDKLGIQADMEHIGEYKSATEALTQKSMSAPAREAANSMLDALYGQIVQSISESRDLDSTEVVSIIDRGPYTSKQAYEAGLVDSLLYPDELDALLPGGEDGPRVNVREYLAGLPRDEGPITAPRIAVVHATGTIVSGKSGTDPVWGRTVGCDTFIGALEDACADKNVKAIVVRIDSPGGEVYASHLMWRAIKKAAQDRPVVASFSDLAASGGYYMAMGADTLVSDVATLTGSIGVLGGKFNLSGLYDKLGLSVEVLTRGANAQFLSPYRNFTPAERERYVHEMLDEYNTFVGIVAHNRGRPEEEIDKLARGRVWTGAQALDRGLVDEMGGLEHSIEIAKHMAGMKAGEAARIVVYPKVERTFLQQMVSRALNEDDWNEDSYGIARGALASSVRQPLELVGALARLARTRTLALLPFRIEIR